jgi:hypothetical protein
MPAPLLPGTSGTQHRLEPALKGRFAVFRSFTRDDFQNMLFSLARIWIKVTPLCIFWWPAGNTDEAPHSWHAPGDIQLLPSDPAPEGNQPPPWKKPEADWRPLATRAVQHLG